MKLSKRMKNLTGLTFGSLTALRPLQLSKQGTVIWEFSCVCGNTVEQIGNNIVCLAKQAVNSTVPSCGCVKAVRAIECHTTHGNSRHPLHTTWQAMKQRCYNQNHPQYTSYGGSGVTVCTEWLDSADTFFQWAVTNGWSKGLHLDKDALSDTQGLTRVYGPSTCKFISAKENVSYSARRSNWQHNPKIKLTPEDVLDIQQLYQRKQLNQYELAARFGVSQACVWRAIHKA